MLQARMFASADTCMIRGAACNHRGPSPTAQDDGVVIGRDLRSGGEGEVGDEWKMVGGDERSGRAYEVGFEEFERRFVVAVIERDYWEQTGERSRNAQRVAWTEGLEGIAKQMRSEAAGPLVEIADDQARAGELRACEDLFAEEYAGLTAALVKSGAQMDIEDMQDLRADLDVSPERATLFAARGEVVIVPEADGQARECEIAVGATVQRSIRAESRVIAGQCAFDLARLVV